jgi:MFS transporter, PPP family, 3-phenylpropionic acid transporter
MRWLRTIYLCWGIAGGVLGSFVPVLMRAKGLDPAAIGLAMSLASIAYTISVPIWGHVSDMLVGPRRALQMAVVPAAIVCIGYGVPVPWLVVVGCQLVISSTGWVCGSLSDSITLRLGLGGPAQYARLRLLSSLGAGAAALSAGLIYSIAGYEVVAILYATAMVAILLAAQAMPFGRDSERHRRARSVAAGEVHVELDQGRFGSIGEAIGLRPRILAILVTAVIAFCGVMAAGTYIGLLVQDRGGGPLQVGLLNGLGFGAEMVGMVIAGWLIARLGARTVLVASCAGFSACAVGYVAVSGVALIIAIRVLAGICFCGIWVSLVIATSSLLPPRLQATGQTLLGAASWGVSAIGANMVAGYLYGSIGPAGAFGFAAVSTALGAVAALFALPRGERTPAGVRSASA